MKNIVIPILLLMITSLQANAQIEGFWVAVDHEDGLEKSVVEIYEQNGKIFARVDHLLPGATVTHCTGCEGELKNKPLPGLIIIKDLNKTSKGGKGGSVLDPATGKWYSCYLELLDNGKLKMRGYLGMPAFGQSQIWYRKK